MPSTYYDSQLTAAEIEAALEAINGVIAPANNGKILAIVNGKIVPKSVTDYVNLNLQSKTVTPSASQQVIQPDSGYNGLDSVTIDGDADLVAGNIKKDVQIFGVTGSYEGSGSSPLVVPPLQYVKYSHYCNALGKESYYSEAVETCVSYELEINAHYILSLNGSPGPRFRRGMFDTEPFTIVPSTIPEPGSLTSVIVQEGVAVDAPSGYYNPLTENPAAYSMLPFTATKRYLAVHLSLNAGEDVTCYLFKIV